MREITTSYQRFDQQVKAFKRHNSPFRHIIGKNTEELHFGKDFRKVIAFVPKQLDPKELAFVKQVKKFVAETGKPQKNISTVKYFSRANIPDRTTYNDCMEMDINKAYWVIALQKGYINEYLFDKGLTFRKGIRLIAFGNIASVKEVWEHRQGEMIELEPISNPVTRSYYFDVCSHLDDIMNNALNTDTDHLIFYWVDAFFCKNKTDFHHQCNDQLKNYVAGFDLGVKYQPIKSITRSGNVVEVLSLVGELKKFYVCNKIKKTNFVKFKHNLCQHQKQLLKKQGQSPKQLTFL